ncbi:MAG: NUDIX hydrolase [Gammaproteobacteria bacterium]
MERNEIYKGRIIELTVDAVELPNGHRAELEIVHHPGGAAVVAVDAEQRVCLLHQYRYAVGGWLWELPAGKIDHPEAPLSTAQRELAEEAGVAAQRWQPLGSMISSPGVFTEQVYLYLAQQLQPVPAAAEDHEVFEVHWRPFSEALEDAVSGVLTDAKSVIGLLRAAACLGIAT